ncbi:MAG: PCRF domain-containing protein, partial [Roseicyclus sp.]
MLPQDRLRQITDRFEYLEAQLNAGPAGDKIAAISREYAELKPVVEQIAAYDQLCEGRAEAEAMLSDPEMAGLAGEELDRIKAALPGAEHALQLALLPRDAADARPAMIEIRPGTGGDEAALFAG